MKTKYRVVTDDWLGFEVQQWSLWWPFWSQREWANTFSSLDAALQLINKLQQVGRVVWTGPA